MLEIIGAVTGFLGGIGEKIFAERQAKTQLEADRAKYAHDLAISKQDAENMRAEAEAAITREAMVQEGASEDRQAALMEASIKHDLGGAVYSKGLQVRQWVADGLGATDILRGSIRPVITIASLAAYLIMLKILPDLQSALTESFYALEGDRLVAAERASEFLSAQLEALRGLNYLMVSWWFGRSKTVGQALNVLPPRQAHGAGLGRIFGRGEGGP